MSSIIINKIDTYRQKTNVEELIDALQHTVLLNRNCTALPLKAPSCQEAFNRADILNKNAGTSNCPQAYPSGSTQISLIWRYGWSCLSLRSSSLPLHTPDHNVISFCASVGAESMPPRDYIALIACIVLQIHLMVIEVGWHSIVGQVHRLTEVTRSGLWLLLLQSTQGYPYHSDFFLNLVEALPHFIFWLRSTRNSALLGLLDCVFPYGLLLLVLLPDLLLELFPNFLYQSADGLLH